MLWFTYLESYNVKHEVVIEGELKCSKFRKGYLIKDGLPNFIVKPCLKLSNRIQKFLYNIYAPLYNGLERKLAELLGFSEEELRTEVVSRMDIKREK